MPIETKEQRVVGDRQVRALELMWDGLSFTLSQTHPYYLGLGTSWWIIMEMMRER